MFGGLEEVGGSRGVLSSGCLGNGGLGCLKVWMGSEVLEGFGGAVIGGLAGLGGGELGGWGVWIRLGVWDVQMVRCLEVGGLGVRGGWVF